MQRNKRIKASVPLERAPYLLHPYSTSLVTSKGKSGKINVMAVAWIIPVSVNPPLLALSIRPERYSHNLILETGEFAVNIPTFELAQKVLFCGRRSGRNHDKFEEASLSPQRAKTINAPIIGECIAHLECRLVKTVETGDHTLFIGRIAEAYALENYLKEVYDMTKFNPCLHLGKNLFTTCVEESVEPEM